jgi:hypothetical protein
MEASMRKAMVLALLGLFGLSWAEDAEAPALRFGFGTDYTPLSYVVLESVDNYAFFHQRPKLILTWLVRDRVQIEGIAGFMAGYVDDDAIYVECGFGLHRSWSVGQHNQVYLGGRFTGLVGIEWDMPYFELPATLGARHRLGDHLGIGAELQLMTIGVPGEIVAVGVRIPLTLSWLF